MEKTTCLRNTMDLLLPSDSGDASSVMGADELVPALCYVITRSVGVADSLQYPDFAR